MFRSTRLRVAVLLAGILAIAGGGVLVARDDDAPRDDELSTVGLPELGEVADRVERIRELEFEELPEIEVLRDEDDVEGAILELSRDADERLSAERERQVKRQTRAAQALVEITGILEPGTQLSASGSDELSLGGLYDHERNRILLVAPTFADDKELAERILAHELTHALEHQRFGTREITELTSEPAFGYVSLLEGSATLVELEYARRHLGAEGDRSELLTRLRAETEASGLPQALADFASFPYVAGGDFANRLFQAGGWKLLDEAQRRPPDSSAEILHPDRWRAGEEPITVALPDAGAPGAGWRSVGTAALGEFDTMLVIGQGNAGDRAAEAAAGWAGGSTRVWERTGKLDCRPPCRDTRAAVLAWVWETERDAREFDRALRRYVRRKLEGRPAGANAWRLSPGAIAYVARGRRSALGFAPELPLARRVAAAAGS